MATITGNGTSEYKFRRSVSQRRTYRKCGYKWLLHYVQHWRLIKDRGQWVFGHVMEDVATGIAAGWLTTPNEAAWYFAVQWQALDPATVEWSPRVKYDQLAEEGLALSRVIVPEIQERILLPTDVEQMIAQEKIDFTLSPEVPELSVPDLWCWLRADLFSDYHPTILDFKTSDRSFIELSIEMDEQLTDYQLAEEAQGRIAAQLGLCVMIRGKEPRVQWLLTPRRDDDVIDRFVSSAVDIDAAITAGQFWQNDRACFEMGVCEYVPLCYRSQANQIKDKLTRDETATPDVFTGWED